jgi:hypothetical protein
MVALDRIRLTGLLRKTPAQAGVFYCANWMWWPSQKAMPLPQTRHEPIHERDTIYNVGPLRLGANAWIWTEQESY